MCNSRHAVLVLNPHHIANLVNDLDGEVDILARVRRGDAEASPGKHLV
jgi:hypothetical protein